MNPFDYILVNNGSMSPTRDFRDKVFGLESKTIKTNGLVSSSRPRLKLPKSQDRDSSRPKNFQVVETETCREWIIEWLSRPRLDFDETFQGSLVKLCKSCFDTKKLNNEATPTLWLIYYMDGLAYPAMLAFGLWLSRQY